MTQGILSNLKIGSAVSDVKPLHSCIDPKIIPKSRDLRTGKNWKILDELGRVRTESVDQAVRRSLPNRFVGNNKKHVVA